jgi:hypothetical protein
MFCCYYPNLIPQAPSLFTLCACSLLVYPPVLQLGNRPRDLWGSRLASRLVYQLSNQAHSQPATPVVDQPLSRQLSHLANLQLPRLFSPALCRLQPQRQCHLASRLGNQQRCLAESHRLPQVDFRLACRALCHLPNQRACRPHCLRPHRQGFLRLYHLDNRVPCQVVNLAANLVLYLRVNQQASLPMNPLVFLPLPRLIYRRANRAVCRAASHQANPPAFPPQYPRENHLQGQVDSRRLGQVDNHLVSRHRTLRLCPLLCHLWCPQHYRHRVLLLNRPIVLPPSPAVYQHLHLHSLLVSRLHSRLNNHLGDRLVFLLVCPQAVLHLCPVAVRQVFQQVFLVLNRQAGRVVSHPENHLQFRRVTQPLFHRLFLQGDRLVNRVRSHRLYHLRSQLVLQVDSRQ